MRKCLRRGAEMQEGCTVKVEGAGCGGASVCLDDVDKLKN